MNWLDRYADPVYCIVRILIGLMFACHGGNKILFFPPAQYGPATNPTGLVAGWIELSGGFLIAFGFPNPSRCIHRQRRNGRRLFSNFLFRKNTTSWTDDPLTGVSNSERW